MRWNLERTYFLGFLSLFAILTGLGMFAYVNIHRLIAISDAVDLNGRTIASLDEMLTEITGAESAERDDLLAGQLSLLDPYRTARAQLDNSLRDIGLLVSDDPSQQAALLRLKPLLAQLLHEIQSATERPRQRIPSATGSILAGQASATLSPIQREIRAMKVRETTKLRQHRVERAEIERRVTLAAGTGMVLTILVTGASLELRRRSTRLRRRALEELHESEAKFRTLAESVAASLFIVQDGRFRYVNPATTTISGYTADDLYSIKFTDLIHPDDREVVRGYSLARVRGESAPSRYEFRLTARDGSVRWGDVSTAVIQHEGRPAVVGLAYDITERKRGEQQLEKQLEHLNALRAIDRAITGSVDLRLTFDTLLSESCRQLRMDAAAALVLDPNSQTLDFITSRGFRTSALQRTHLRVGEGFAGRAALERRVVYIPALMEADILARSPLLADEGFVAYFAVPLIAKGLVRGVLEIFHRAPFEADSEWLDLLDTIAGQAAIAIDDATLFNELQQSNSELLLAYDSTIEGWSRALDLRDKETEGHTQRVTEMTLRLARSLGVNSSELIHIRRGALLHDIGKMGIPDAILHKPGPLSEEEWIIMRKHPQMAHELLAPISYLRPALDIPYCHHEKWDGTGYPRGLRGEQIPRAARMFAVVDVWDALTSDRPYRAAWGEAAVREHLRAQAGTHFDPQMVEAFLTM